MYGSPSQSPRPKRSTVPTDIRLAIKRDADEWVFWAEFWRADTPAESISNTTYASEDADGMLEALQIIRDTVDQTYSS